MLSVRCTPTRLPLAGGPQQDRGGTVTLTRQQEYGPPGIRGETQDSSKGTRTAKVDLMDLIEGKGSRSNVATVVRIAGI